jgi:hypothetical protein
MGSHRIAAVVLSAVALGMTAPQAAGPIGYWKLDETASPSVDSVADADGTWTGVQSSTDVPTTTFDNCASIRVRTAAAAGGVNYVSLGRSAALDASQNGSFTISAWFKPNSLPTGDPDGQYGIVLKTGLHEGLSMDGSGGIVMGHWVGSAPNYYAAGYGTGTATVGQWHHVAGVVNLDPAVMTVTVYTNGQAPPFNASAALPAGATAWPGYSNAPWLLGINDPNGGNARYQADGWIDDVRIYGRALTLAEIQTLAGGGTVGDPPVTPPATPVGLSATATASQVTLDWTPVPGASGYNVKRSDAPGAETQYALAPSDSFVDDNVLAGTRYYYVVTAIVGCSESSNSDEVFADVAAPTPRTHKIGGEDNPCGCGSSGVGMAGLILAAAVAGLLLLLPR